MPLNYREQEKAKFILSGILYAEHQGDVIRELYQLAPLLGLPQPIENESEMAWERPEIWPWDKDLFDEEDE